MPRFFVNKKNIIDDKYIIVDGSDVKHIKNVLRLNINDEIQLCDGKSKEFYVKIIDIKEKTIKTKIYSMKKNTNEAGVYVTLYQALPKGDKFDLIIQKCVELGISRIIPVITERTIVNIKNEKILNKKLDRWNKISLEASKQSRRGIVPKVFEPILFNEAIKMLKSEDILFIAYEKESKNTLKTLNLNNKKSIGFFIGPEGGFSDNEIDEVNNNKITTISLGSRILRTETAGITVLSIIMYKTGDV